MEHEGNGFNDTYKTSEGNTTLDEPMATAELPVEQRLFLGWSFGKEAFIKYVGIISGIFDPFLFAHFMHPIGTVLKQSKKFFQPPPLSAVIR